MRAIPRYQDEDDSDPLWTYGYISELYEWAEDAEKQIAELKEGNIDLNIECDLLIGQLAELKAAYQRKCKQYELLVQAGLKL